MSKERAEAIRLGAREGLEEARLDFVCNKNAEIHAALDKGVEPPTFAATAAALRTNQCKEAWGKRAQKCLMQPLQLLTVPSSQWPVFRRAYAAAAARQSRAYLRAMG